MGTYPEVSVFPGLALFITALAVNLSGDWLRDRLDPKLR
jgi:ABC-type dipeptide/oligopeptide/nickel transport system permease subunit